jgi:hypothetical protein
MSKIFKEIRELMRVKSASKTCKWKRIDAA